MKIRIITQCRMTSTRLPGKILLPLGRDTVLGLHLQRLKSTNLPITIATTQNTCDDELVVLANRYGVDIVRGSEEDVLSRFINVIDKWDDDWIVRVTSDCPFIDPTLIMQGVALLEQHIGSTTYVSNCFPRTYARGFDFEICHSDLLREAMAKSSDAFDHEHVTPYLWQNKNGRMHLCNVSEMEDNSHWRLCIDTEEDYQLCQYLEQQFGASSLNFKSIHEIMHMHPELGKINAHIEQKKK